MLVNRLLGSMFEGKDFSPHLVAWWAHQDLNLEPTDYESAALTVELWARIPLLSGNWSGNAP